MRVYIYDASWVPPCESTAGGLNFELFLPNALREMGIVTDDPSLADVFYHPACLVSLYFQTRPPDFKADGTISPTAQATEARVLKQIRDLGHGHRLHIINSMRCSTRGAMAHKHSAATYPKLWGSQRFARVCGEAPFAVDRLKAIQMW